MAYQKIKTYMKHIEVWDKPYWKTVVAVVCTKNGDFRSIAEKNRFEQRLAELKQTKKKVRVKKYTLELI
jgi:hypothetical protein